MAEWTTAAREADLSHVYSFARGINQDIDGRTEGVNTKTKLRNGRCMDEQVLLSYATASFSDNTPPPKVRAEPVMG